MDSVRFKLLLIFFSVVSYSVSYSQNIPQWVTHPPSNDDDYFYSVGVKSSANTLEDGLQEAVGNAVGKIVDYLGITASRKYESVKTEYINRFNIQYRQYSEK